MSFGTQINDSLPIRFWPEKRQDSVAIGEKAYNTYYFKNTSTETVRFRPIHSVSPPDANRVYAMTVCFCFNDQEIEPGGEREFEIEYILGKDLDRRVTSVQVNYSLHHITKDEMKPPVQGEEMQQRKEEYRRQQEAAALVKRNHRTRVMNETHHASACDGLNNHAAIYGRDCLSAA